MVDDNEPLPGYPLFRRIDDGVDDAWESTVRRGALKNEKRDTHLRSADFFDAARRPAARFVSKKVTPLRDGRFRVLGNLTLRGVTRPVVLDVDYNGSVKDPWGGERAAFTATAKLNRQNFGVKWNQTLDNGGVLISDEVKLEFEIEGSSKQKNKGGYWL